MIFWAIRIIKCSMIAYPSTYSELSEAFSPQNFRLIVWGCMIITDINKGNSWDLTLHFRWRIRIFCLRYRSERQARPLKDDTSNAALAATHFGCRTLRSHCREERIPADIISLVSCTKCLKGILIVFEVLLQTFWNALITNYYHYQTL